ncbi:MAG: NAD-dependent epimerase/dehydratase family protein [Terriglobia bacterium]
MSLVRILVTGAAGYVGSIVTEHLIKQGHAVTAVYVECIQKLATVLRGGFYES